MSIITAKEARAMDPKRQCEADLVRLGELIQKEARSGSAELRVPRVMVDVEGHTATFRTPGVHEALEAAGYTITQRYETHQFVDIWLEISWQEVSE